jgi:glycine oxidase
VVVGGGVMGCAIGLELAARGRSVVVLERSVPGAEASSAAAGMLGAQIEAHGPGPFLDLSVQSRALFPAMAERLRELTGIDVEYRRSGIVRAAMDEAGANELCDLVAWQRAAGLRASLLDAAAAREAEPVLAPAVTAGALFEDDGRVDPPRYLRALRIAAERSGVRFSTGSLVRRVHVEQGRARGVLLEDGEVVRGEHVVVAAGSWSSLVEGATLDPGVVKPARGQIVELVSPMPVLRHVLWGPGAYLSPRDDGRVLVGSTLEFVGFERVVTAGAVATLLGAAIALVPALARAELVRAWAAFRPYTADLLPILGETATPGLVLATGHYRNGILLSPITARIVAAIAEGEAPPIDLAPFAPRVIAEPREATRGDA